ncbi:hypothetical protein H4W80_007836 [Nonomuraea angiospora]|uniref:Uncharacterized protein n=1 Tax=Nonomuraea angiospora TaxID=46172 RepID=A0ABR9M9I7_9ACTN|nr:hypothetical protein [Nonomuraea angiospora]
MLQSVTQKSPCSPEHGLVLAQLRHGFILSRDAHSRRADHPGLRVAIIPELERPAGGMASFGTWAQTAHPHMRSSWLCHRPERAMPRRRPSEVRTRGSACGTHRALIHHVPGRGRRPMAAVIALEHTRMWPGTVAAALVAWPHLYALVLPIDSYYLRRTSPMPPTSPDSDWAWWQRRLRSEDRSE